MKIIIALLIGLACSVGAYAQNNPAAENKPVIILPDTARYQLLRFGAGSVIKLDRYTGKTYIYDLMARRRWHLLEVRGGLPAGSAANTTPKYQIYFEDELTAMLINNETGQTWHFAQRAWEPIAG